MVTISKPEEILRAYEHWLAIDEKPFWAIGHQPKAFIQKHVNSTDCLICEKHEASAMDVYYIPTSIVYPLAKRGAGVVLTKNTFEILWRNLPIKALQDFLMEWLTNEYPGTRVTKGLKHNSNDLYINGKKIFGELSFSRAGQTYYACMINMEVTPEDKEAIKLGLSDDKNFYEDKLHAIGGIKNEVKNFEPAKLMEDLEHFLFNRAAVPEYTKY